MPKEKVQDLRQAIERRLQNAIDQGVYKKGQNPAPDPSGYPDDNEDLCIGALTPTTATRLKTTNRLEKIVDHAFGRKWNSESTAGGILDDPAHGTFDAVVSRLTSLESRIEKLSDHLLKGKK